MRWSAPMRTTEGRIGRRMEGPRVCEALPRRTKGVLVGAHEVSMKSQGTEGPRAHSVAPRRMITGAVVV